MAYTRFPPTKEAVAAGPVPAAAPEAAVADTPPRGRTRAAVPAAQVPSERINPLVLMFILAIFTPLLFNLGSLALTPARLMLFVLFVPVGLMYLMGKGGRPLPQDFFVFGFALWTVVALYVYGGFKRLEFMGSNVIEIVTPFLLARILIRSEAQYNAFLKLMMVLITIVGCAAAFEARTDRQIINEVFSVFGRVYPPPPESYGQRLGMNRAQTVFQHPILYGVAMSVFMAPIWFMTRPDGRIAGWSRGLIVMMATFFSLSTGAWLGIVVQTGLMMWNKIFASVQARWKILTALVIAAYITIDLLSNRTPFDVFISYATMNPGTGYWRKLIFIYGMESVWANPLYGVGMNDWERPSWMFSGSVDNFWLATAMRFGIPAFVGAAGAYLSIIYVLCRAKPQSESLRRHRLGTVFSLVGMGLSLATVHFWGTAYYLIWFFLGANSWMVVAARAEAEAAAGGDGADPDPAPVRGAARQQTRRAAAAPQAAPARPYGAGSGTAAGGTAGGTAGQRTSRISVQRPSRRGTR